MSKEKKTLYRLDRRALLRNTAVGITLPSVLAPPVGAEIAPGPGDGGGKFDTVSGQALSLAIEITGLSPSIDQTMRVNDTLDALKSQIKNGNVNTSVAIDAVERMKLGENITETAIAVLGPSVVPSPENSRTLVGAPAGSPAADAGFDIAGTTIENVLLLATTILILIAGYARVTKYLGPTGSALQKAISAANDLVTTAIGAIPYISGALKDKAHTIKGTSAGKITDRDATDKNQIYDIIIEPVSEARDSLADLLIKRFEQSIGNHPFDDELADFDAALGADDGTLSLRGTQSGAMSAAANGIERVNDRVRTAQDRLDVLGVASFLGGLLQTIGVLFSATGVGVIVGAIGTVFGITFGAGSVASGTSTLFDVQGIHNTALNNIVNGTTGV